MPHPRHPEVPLEGDGEDHPGLANALPASGSSPAEQAARTEQNSAVRSAVSALPDDLREAIVLCELEDCSIAEPAAVLRTTAKAVESRLYRARQQLRQRLARWFGAN